MNDLSLVQAAEKIANRDIRAEEYVEYYLQQIAARDEDINAFISVNSKALQQAKDLDARLDKGEKLGPLVGIPIAVKDNICTKSLATTAGSKILHNFIPPYSATCVTKLCNSGALILGKTNLDEFAMGASNETSYFGPCRNPWNKERVAGGSSGGSAAAVASGMSPAALGSDTGGSVRQPAAFCGVVGVKPTYGTVSRYGLISYASSLDQVGPIARDVRDAALLTQAIVGIDDNDFSTTRSETDFFGQIGNSIKGVKVGIVEEYESEQLTGEVETGFNNCLSALRDLDADIVNISIPKLKYALSCYYLIAMSEASSNLARYDGIRYGHRADLKELEDKSLDSLYRRTRAEGFGKEVKRRIMLGTYALSSGYYDAYYLKACQLRRLLRDEYVKSFAECDLILSPVCAELPFVLGEKQNDPLDMYLTDTFTVTANLCGFPAMSMPVGLSSDRLPLGVQIMAPHFGEARMFQLAAGLENELKPVIGRLDVHS